MPFEQFPYTNFHELNQDWLIKTVKEVKDKTEDIDEAVAEAEASAENAKASELNAKTSELNAQNYAENVETYTQNLSQQVNTNTQNIAVNSGRIDTFTNLPAGSTAGDAELIDIRVGANGVTYANAGDAVRAQIDLVNDRVDTITNRTLHKYTQENYDVSTFTADAGDTDWFWLNNQTFPAGYIDHFVIYGTNDSIGSYGQIAVYDTVTGKFIWRSEKVLAETRTLNVPCQIKFSNPVYVCISLPHLAHDSIGNTVQYARMWEFAVWAEGAVFNIDFVPGNVQFKFAVECWYADYYDADNLHFTKERNRMFIAGDSITAGYPYSQGVSRPNYYDPDIKWGEQIKRKLGFDVTFGASSGSGWIYRTAPDAQYAISIADNNNFANYDTVVFAFGTNDYGNNMPLGSIYDLYPANQTICGAINYVLNKIYTDNPKAVVIISTPINRSDKGNASSNYAYGTQNTEGYTLMDLLERMIQLCDSKGVCYIDSHISPFNVYTVNSLLVDNLHPNPEGYKVLGAFMAGQISKYVSPYIKNVESAEF